MTDYIVTWQAVIVDATSPEDAALKAFRLMQDRNTTATEMIVRGPDGKSYNIDTEEIPR